MSNNEHYSKLVNMADKHIEKLNSANKKLNDQTLAALMFIKSHKNYIKFLVLNSKIRCRQDDVLKFIKENVGSFDKDVVKWELTKIGIPSHAFMERLLALIFISIYIFLAYYFYPTGHDETSLANYHVDVVGCGVIYSMIMWSIGAKFLCSKLPLYFYKKY